MKIGVIGCGAMGSAIVKGMISSHAISSENIMVKGKDFSQTGELKNIWKVNETYELKEIVEFSDYVIIAVKPKDYKNILEQMSCFEKKPIIVSIAAGYEIDRILSEVKDKNRKVIRTMPNTPAQILKGVVGICSKNVNSEELQKIKDIFSVFAKVVEIEEEQMHIFSAISGSMPAFVDIFIEAASEIAVKHGMNREKAYEIISYAISGSAEMVGVTKKHPAKLKDDVTSPSGTTIEGVIALEKNGFRYAIIDALDKTFEKSKNM